MRIICSKDSVINQVKGISSNPIKKILKKKLGAYLKDVNGPKFESKI